MPERGMISGASGVAASPPEPDAGSDELPEEFLDFVADWDDEEADATAGDDVEATPPRSPPSRRDAGSAGDRAP
jgi:hypothetical protein